MPELPDLEAVRSFLNPRLSGRTITQATVRIPVVVRTSAKDFTSFLEGRRFESGEPITRLGKFLLFALEGDLRLVINPMLTGRFQYAPPQIPRRTRTCFLLALDDGYELRYADERLMGKVYVVPAAGLQNVPQIAEVGPDVLNASVTEAVFSERLKRYTGQIKHILVNQRFLAGIGNAYADEILWAAGIHPYRRRTTLTAEEMDRLYRAMHDVLAWATRVVTEKMHDALDYDEWRDHLRVHRRGGQPCPRCGSPLVEITAGGQVTNFCRTCQPMPSDR